MEAASYSTITKRGADSQLPEVLITQILSRLPVKPVLRFKSVSKTWYVLIKSPYFISVHHKFNLGGGVSRLLMCSSPDSQQLKDVNNHAFTICSNLPDYFGANPDTYVYLAPVSCNGIVCYFDEFGAIFMSNPATGQFKQLPPTSFTDPKFDQFGLAFGFGSANIYDFKVLRLLSSVSKKGFPEHIHMEVRAEMFTLSSNSWRQINWGLEDDAFVFCSDQGFLCANSFHFIARRRNFRGEAIVCCDVDTERFRTMELPSTGNGSFVSLMVFKGFISAVSRVPAFRSEGRSIEIWIMKDYGVVESWTKLYSIGPPWPYGLPLCFWTEKDALLFRLREEKTYKLISYHPNSLSFERVEIEGYNGYSQFVVYQETLVSIM